MDSVNVIEEPVGNAIAASGAIWRAPELGGEQYEVVLDRFHKIFKPKSYLEIGVFQGGTLRLATCPSIAIDPYFSITHPVVNNKQELHFYQHTSDVFFDNFNPEHILGRKIDMAFLDGLHKYEYLLRDFYNTERFCRRNSIIFFHDCLPSDAFVGRRDRSDYRLQAHSEKPDWWAGDVWKTVAILKKSRPDLIVVVFDAPPTGLVAITNLDPSSMVLADQYFDLVREYRDKELADVGDGYVKSLRIVSTRQMANAESLEAEFWL